MALELGRQTLTLPRPQRCSLLLAASSVVVSRSEATGGRLVATRST
jgi:hypothetical protein